jgi:hypothetical protein
LLAKKKKSEETQFTANKELNGCANLAQPENNNDSSINIKDKVDIYNLLRPRLERFLLVH